LLLFPGLEDACDGIDDGVVVALPLLLPLLFIMAVL